MAIQKRPNGTYGVSVYDPALGRKRWAGTAKTERDAKRLEAAALADERDRGRTPTLAEWCARWVDECPRPKASSDATNRERARHIARQPFARQPLDRIRPADVAAWAQANVSAHAAARAMFNDAIRLGLTTARNPFAELRVQRGTGRKHVTPPDEGKVSELAGLAPYPGLRALILAGAWTGLRPGELFALRPGDVDLAAREIRVERQYVTKTAAETAVKNGRPRTAVILEPAVQALADVLAEDGRLVFSTPRGARFTQGNLHYWWSPVRAGAGLPGLDFYMLRHFHGSYLVNALRLPAQDVAAQLGHTDGGRLVMELYGHPSAVLARDRIRRAQAGLGSTGAGVRVVSGASGQHGDRDAWGRRAV